ncbi:hypothetical protein HX882_08835 [Pseudomonas gingeri]|uniref:Uncharacterized protein n=1 Tax=Pseudomonas gingeri TaxID=117681 RepID=A0A7Y7XAF9_9PSED|nr:hypothetical protein [Pseudomonas gingeri]NWB95991.1 hypothetical protein [Pseudomonas gingeri]NWD76847.1 hypothetical protein [Pseudomonas gingeri]
MSHTLSEYHYFQRSLGTVPNTETSSCLTINQAGSPLGLSNLLDLISHEISRENNQQIHRLTFKSGQTLCIKADSELVTVRGRRINFHADSTYPYTTFLEDPARSGSRQKSSR